MNLISETKRKLEYQKANLIDLQECIKQPVTKDCIHYLKEQLERAEKGVKYYAELLEVLEKDKGGKK